VAKLDLHCGHVDVVCAVLYADLDEEIHMDQPEGSFSVVMMVNTLFVS
jgi:hypothetical protein